MDRSNDTFSGDMKYHVSCKLLRKNKFLSVRMIVKFKGSLQVMFSDDRKGILKVAAYCT